MSLRRCALAIVCFMLWSHAHAARGQAVHYPVHRTPRATQGPMTIRGQDSMEPPKFDDSSDTLELMPVVDLEVSETVWFSKNGWYSAVDVGVMKQSDTMFGTDGTWGEEVAAPRLTIGWENEEGYGVRGKLWHYKSSTDPFTVDREINSTLLPGVAGSVAPLRPYFVLDQPREDEAITFDLDLYKRLDWGSNEFTFGSGIKSVGQTTTFATTDTLWGSQSRLEGVGISLFASGRKSLYATETRASMPLRNMMSRLSPKAGRHSCGAIKSGLEHLIHTTAMKTLASTKLRLVWNGGGNCRIPSSIYERNMKLSSGIYMVTARSALRARV